jgi:Arc/MetJ family transcription regulator
MPTNLAIDDRLLRRALRIGGKKTKKDTVNTALQEYIERREQKKILALFGSVADAGAGDPKRFRRRA